MLHQPLTKIWWNKVYGMCQPFWTVCEMFDTSLDFLHHIVTKTNYFVNKCIASKDLGWVCWSNIWNYVTKGDIWTFLAVTVITALIKCIVVKTTEWLTTFWRCLACALLWHTTGFSCFGVRMPTVCLLTTQPVIICIMFDLSTWKTAYYLNCEVSVDESVTACARHTDMSVYKPNKSHKRGLALSDTRTGYMWDLETSTLTSPLPFNYCDVYSGRQRWKSAWGRRSLLVCTNSYTTLYTMFI